MTSPSPITSQPWLSSFLGTACHHQPISLHPNDLTQLVDEACHSGLAGVFLEQTSRLQIDLPLSESARLQSHALRIAASNLHLDREIEPILTALSDASIPVMLLKGLALRLDIYPRPDLRPMSDVDLLIQSRDLHRAFDVLYQIGCRGGTDLSKDRLFPNFHNEVEFFSPGPRPVRIDLHVRPFRSLRISQLMSDSALWDQPVPKTLGRAPVLLPSPTNMFLHLSAHAAFHGFSRLLWLYDIARWMSHHNNQIEWTLASQRAIEWGLALPVHKTVTRIHGQFGIPIPRDLHSNLSHHHPTWTERMTLAQTPHDATSPIRHVLTNLLCISGCRFRLNYLSALFHPGSRHLADSYSHRHFGWTTCAQARRFLRGALRFLKWTTTPFRRLPVLFEPWPSTGRTP